MTWLEISFDIPASLADLCSETLENLGAASVSLYNAGSTPVLEPLPGTTPLWDQLKIVGLFQDNVDSEYLQSALHAIWPSLNLSIAPLAEQEWSRTWLEHFRPMQFGQRLWVVPGDQPLPEVDPNAVIVSVDPGLAFGTGTHPTTALCLQWLDAHPPHSQTVIDYGCGSGILGIAAIKLGAKIAYMVDYDPQALIATQNNAKRNRVSEQVITQEPDRALVQAQTILANILAEPLIQLAPTLQQYCLPGGNIILSGLLETQAEAVQAAYRPWFRFTEIQQKEEWMLLVGSKN